MVFAHYRNLVKPREAERYWKIAPAPLDKKIITFAAAAAKPAGRGTTPLRKATKPR
jgi:hypothetical protein